MKRLSEEICRRFPEFKSLGDYLEESGYLAMGELSSCLIELARRAPEQFPTKKIVELSDWCYQQQPGGDASDDAVTIYVVSLFEDLCADKATHQFIPQIDKRGYLTEAEDYLRRWIGSENLDSILEHTRM